MSKSLETGLPVLTRSWFVSLTASLPALTTRLKFWLDARSVLVGSMHTKICAVVDPAKVFVETKFIVALDDVRTLSSPVPSISEAKWTFAPFVLASSMTFVMSHAGIFSSFSHSLYTAAFCCGYLHCLRHRNKFVYQIVMLQWNVPFSCNKVLMIFRKDSSIRCLLDLLASKIHAHFDLNSLVLPRVSPCLLFLLVLQGITGAIGVSNVLRAFLMVSLNSLSSGSMK